MTVSGVYKIKNVLTGEEYVGSTRNIIQRWREHKSALRHQKHNNPLLQRAWDLHGEEAFFMESLEPVKDPSHRLLIEQVWMDWLKPAYNRAPFAGSSKGMKYPKSWMDKQRARVHSCETKAKISMSLMGNTHRADWLKKHKEA